MLLQLHLPSLKGGDLEYVTLNPRFSDVHWLAITKLVRFDYGVGKITEPVTVRHALDTIYGYLVENFEQLATAAASVGFLMFVHRIHESSVLISTLFQEGNAEIRAYLTPQDLKELPSIRRVLKLIMEAVLQEQFNEEIGPALRQTALSTPQNVALLEELVYLGAHALELKEHINICSMYEKAVSLQSSWKNQVVIITHDPYNRVFDTVQRDIGTYSNTSYEGVNAELDAELATHFGSNLTRFITWLPGLGTFIIPREECLQEQGLQSDQIEAARPFYAGLTLTARNKMPLADSFQKMQSNTRLIYRPIIEFKDRGGNVYWILGSGKTYESMQALQNNAILWGHLPDEWKACQPLKQFAHTLEQRREGLMIDKIAATLSDRQITHDTGITSLLDTKGHAFTVVTPGLGEIDVLFLNEAHKIIYVCECKNNRPRTDVFYWKSEQRQFAVKYETQLARKHDWVAANKVRVQDHFNKKFAQDYDFSDWRVEGLFLLMTSSIYKYDGSFLVLTVEDLATFVDNGFVFRYPSLGFRCKDRDDYVIPYPYFKNIHRMLQEGCL